MSVANPFLAITVLVISTLGLNAQPRLVTDLNRAPGPATSSSPQELIAVADRTYFSAYNAVVGREIWFTSPQGITLAGNLSPDERSSNPRGLVAYRDGVAFVANGLLGTPDLWVAQGTAWPQRVAGGLFSIHPSHLVTSGSRFFFFGDDGVHGSELWVSNGTTAGTRMVGDITVGPGSSFPVAMVPFRDGVALFVDDGVHGLELWVSLGVDPVTRLVRDLNPGPALGAAYPHSAPVVVGGELYFAGDDGVTGRELWASDGTNMRQVTDLAPGPDSSSPYEPFAFGNRVVFGIDPFPPLGAFPSQPWITDGTAAGTRPLASAAFARPLKFTTLANGRFVFVATAANHTLAVSDGTAAGTALLIPLAEDVLRIDAAGSHCYVQTRSGQLFVTDGTVSGTSTVLLVGMSAAGALVGRPDGSAIFSATRADVGTELWTTQGTVASTRLLADLENTLTTQDALPRLLGGINGRAVFAAATQTGHELFASDGTAAGTRVLTALGGVPNQPAPTLVAELNDALLVYDEQGGRVLRTDGTAAGTRSLGALRVEGARSVARVGAAFDGHRALFSGNAGASGTSQLWMSDGTVTGTRVLADIYPGGSAVPRWFVRDRARMFFIATDAAHGHELWVSDGTTAGTTLVADVQPSASGAAATVSVLGVCNGKVVFTPDDGVHGREPWVSDGSVIGTVLLRDLTPGPAASGFWERKSVNFRDRLLFVTNTGTFSTDGTVAGTQTLPLPGGITDFVALESQVLAFAPEAAGVTMYTTDGTAAGTRRVGYALPYSFTLYGVALSSTQAVIASISPQTSTSWHLTDGTLAGTRSLGSMSAPAYGVFHDGKHYFDARHPTLGSELWVLDLGAAAQAQGLGCGAVPDAVRLSASSPRLGTNLDLRVSTPFVANALLVGRPAHVPITLPAPVPGCSLWVDPGSMVTLALSGASVSIPVPSALEFLGLRLVAQALSGPSVPSGFDLSNGVRLVLDW